MGQAKENKRIAMYRKDRLPSKKNRKWPHQKRSILGFERKPSWSLEKKS